MAGATSREYDGLQRAIAKALAKEDYEAGRVVDGFKIEVTYTAIYQVGSRQMKIESRCLEAFVESCQRMKAKYPKMPVTILERTTKTPVPKL